MKDAVPVGRMAIFKHPMNFKELCLPQCVGDGAYTEEEHRPSVPMDGDGRQSRGIPESAVSRRLTRPRNAAAVAAASTASPAAAGPRASPGPAVAAARGRGGGGSGSAGGGAGGQRGCGGSRA